MTNPVSPATSDGGGNELWLGVDLRKHRWVFPAVGVMTSSIRGAAAYTFSIFILPLEREFGWTRAEVVLVFCFYTFLYALFAFIGGMAVDRIGPRRPFVAGALMIVCSQILASRAGTHFELLMTYGVMLGCGLGLTSSAATVALSARWYPSLLVRGTVIGISVMGIGIGGLVAAPLWHIGLVEWGWRPTFLITAASYGALLAIIASIIRFPRVELRPEMDVTEFGADFCLQEAILHRELWTVALLLFLTLFGGLLVFSQFFPFFTESAAGAGAYGVTVTAVAVVIQSVFSCIGPPSFGWLSGRIGVRFSSALCALCMAGGLTLLAKAGSRVADPASLGGVSIFGIGLIGFAFSGAIALAAASCAAMFGTRYLARIFGMVLLLGFGSAAPLGPLAGAFFREHTGDYHISLYIAAALATLALAFALIALPGRNEERLRSEWS